MKKIIAAIDGLKYNESTVTYAIKIAQQIDAQLVGIFLDDFTYHSYELHDLVGEEGISAQKLERFEEKDRQTREQAGNRFENACREAGLNYAIHHDRSIAIQELLHESIYADLLVVHSKETLNHFKEKIPSRFMHDLLSDVQCPVLVVPSEYNPIDELVLLFDGQPSSVFAIKMFSYIIPTITTIPTEVLSVNNSKQTIQLPDSSPMKEFMERHYPKAEYKIVKGVPETEIVKQIKDKQKHVLAVLGAYQRSAVSRWFRHSMADLLMQETAVPLFIAHSK